jgi:hypothetical protein
MTRCASLSPLGSEFDDFLFAPIGEERSGMRLSVISALARLDVDPWEEARKLAQLPGETATQRLASLIATIPGRPSTQPDPRTIAARLIALLPRRASSNAPSRGTLLGAGAGINIQTVMFAILVNGTFLVFMVGAQWIVANRQPPAQVDNTHAGAASSTVSPRVSPEQVGPQGPSN